MNKMQGLLRGALLAALCLCVCCLPVCAAEEETAEQEIFTIRTPEDLNTLAENCRTDSWSAGRTVVLENDISLAGVDFEPIRYFAGSFDGQDHTISDVSITCSASPCGIFAEIGQSGSVTDLNVRGDIAPTGDAASVGGIAGINNGLIAGCSFTGSVAGSDYTGGIAGENASYGCLQSCRVSGSIRGNSMTGGLVGRNAGSILNCQNESYVNIEGVDPKLNLNDLDLLRVLKSFSVSSADTLGIARDSGGIAGYNTGVIGLCRNSATVGYQHIGYNVGGIAGRGCGYIYSCTNSGEVYGRKDVGGITGQMEPYQDILSQSDLIGNLAGQYNGLAYCMNKTTKDAQALGDEAAEKLRRTAASLGPAIAALGGADFSDPSSVQGALSAAAGALSSFSGSMSGLGSDLQSAGGVIGDDLRGINQQINGISAATSGLFRAVTDPTELQIIYDTSDKDIDSVIYGKTELCENRGIVNGDLNIGGVIGQMSVENTDDPEDDAVISIGGTVRTEYELKAVLIDCDNYGEITARKNCAGGVVGFADLGYVGSCEGYGSVCSESGSYVGGIAGMNRAKLADCWAKCALSGNSYVGGINGCGNTDGDNSSTVTGCCALVRVLSCEQFAGAISGYADGEYRGNVFVSETLQGINGLNLIGQAEPVAYEELIGLPGLPEEFESFTITFTADGEVLKQIHFRYGESPDESEYPAIPEKADCFASWEKVDTEMLPADLTVEAVYRRYDTIIPSNLVRADGRPAMYAEGAFDEDAHFTVVAQTVDESTSARYSDLIRPWYSQIGEQLRNLLSGHAVDATVSREPVECIRLSIPEDGAASHTVRYLLPENVSDFGCRIYIETADGCIQTEQSRTGSYYCFDLEGNEADLVIISTVRTVWLVLAVFAAVTVGIVLLVILLRLVQKRLLRRLGRKVVKDVKRRREGMSKEKRLTAAVSAAVLLAVLAGGGYLFRTSPLWDSIKTGIQLKELLKTEERAYQIDVSGNVGSRTLEQSFTVESFTENGTRISSLSVGNARVFYQDEKVYLPNGIAYSVESTMPDRMDILTAVAAWYQKGDIRTESTPEGVQYTLSLSGGDAKQLVCLLLPTLIDSRQEFESDSMELSLLAENNAFRSLQITGSGETYSGVGYALEATVTPAERTVQIPAAVTAAIAADTEPAGTLTAELMSLLSAWVDFDQAPAQAGTVTLTADCGAVLVNDRLEYFRRVVEQTPISCLKKNSLSVYFGENGMCSANGKPLSSGEQTLGDSAKLLELVENACATSKFSVQNGGVSQIFTLKLSADTVQAIAQTIAPATAKLNISYTGGTVILTLRDGKLRDIDISCSGTLRVVRSDVPASLQAKIAFDDDTTAVPAIPEAVKAALIIPEA